VTRVTNGIPQENLFCVLSLVINLSIEKILFVSLILQFLLKIVSGLTFRQIEILQLIIKNSE